MSTIRQANDRDAILRKQRITQGRYVVEGNTYRKVSSGDSVFYCSLCHAPVVDSDRGRRSHAQRSPRCQTAMTPKMA